MFEAIEDTTDQTGTVDAEQQHAVAQHVQAIFSKAKTLKNTMDELTAREMKRRVGTPSEGKAITHAIQVQGLPEVNQRYSDNLKELETKGVAVSELYLSTIQEQKAAVKSRLEEFGKHQAGLCATLDELLLKESSLNQQSDEYSKLLAQGDIEAADMLENERLNQLKKVTDAQQDTERKLSASSTAESIQKREVGIYHEMFIKAHRNLLMQNYNEVLLPAFNKQFAELEQTFMEMNRTIGRVNASRPEEWGHWANVQELTGQMARNLILSEYQKEQQYYQSLK